MRSLRSLSAVPASEPAVGLAAVSVADAAADIRATYLALRGTGMDDFAAIELATQGDRIMAAQLWLEALRLVDVPAGVFLMGSSWLDPKHHDREGPERQVTIHPFRMGAVPVTQGAWEAVMGANPSEFKGDPTLPVEYVSWDDICGSDGFLHRLNTLTEGKRPEGTVFRLPSEAEWEYACRAGTTTAYSFGDEMEAMVDYGWTNCYADGKTHPVGLKRPNAFGIHDLHGNVWEWCEDTWHDTYNGGPKDGSAWVEDSDNGCRVMRGGSWGYDSPGYSRSACRNGNSATCKGYDIGFRVVLA